MTEDQLDAWIALAVSQTSPPGVSFYRDPPDPGFAARLAARGYRFVRWEHPRFGAGWRLDRTDDHPHGTASLSELGFRMAAANDREMGPHWIVERIAV